MSTATLHASSVRELDQRSNAGITVTLEYDEIAHTCRLTVEDDKDPFAGFIVPVPADRAAHAFQHPFCYQPDLPERTMIPLPDVQEDDPEPDDDPRVHA